MLTCVIRPTSSFSLNNCQSTSSIIKRRYTDIDNDRHVIEENSTTKNEEIRKKEESGNPENDVNYQRKRKNLASSFLFSDPTRSESTKTSRKQDAEYKYAKSELNIDSNQSSALSKEKETNMLFCQQQTSANAHHCSDVEESNNLIPTSTCAAFIEKSTNLQNLLIIDCGGALRHSERHIKNSFLMNASDRLSLKRLSTRGIKHFLNESQIERLNKNEIIILYDDRISPKNCSTSVERQLSPGMKCIRDQIKNYDRTKQIYILDSTFDEFYQQYPMHCNSVSVSSESSFADEFESKQGIDALDCEMSEILPGLFLGNAQDASDIKRLERNQIGSIINVSKSVPCFFENQSNIEYLQLLCDDSSTQDIIQYFESTCKWINERLEKNQRILIHCQAGISRSPSFVIAYLMKYHHKTFDQAYQWVRTRRSIANPNINFIGQLSQYQQILSNA